MTSDKQNNGPLAKPFTPTLSAAFNRTSKSPLTPKLANPGGYRTPKRLAPSEHPSSTPDAETASFLSVNVTPRSGSRNSRRDGFPSPSNAPSSVQSSAQVQYSHAGVAHVGSSGGCRTERSPARSNGRLEPSRGNRAKTLTTERPNTPLPNSYSDSSTSRMFFHAYDARSPNSSDVDIRSKPLSKPSSPATFVYANGEHEEQTQGEEANITAPTVKRRSIGSSRPALAPKALPAASPRLRPAKLADSAARLSDATSQVSSQRDDISEVSSQAHSSFSGAFPARPPIPAVRHIKSSSLDSASSGIHPKEGLKPSPIIVSTVESPVEAECAASESMPGLRPRILSNGSMTSVDTHLSSAAQSPVKSDTGQANNDVVLNARIERKILDLEISNSSLLAINRTLEREMRKQNAELRRYRRLSRSGRLSTAPSTRSFSGTSLGITNELDEEASELSSIRSPEELSDYSDEDSTMDEGVVSPDSLADHDARHRVKDEKRFFIDLAKHQELLADSQKINQSLKRCLGWTEELIKEGKKALEYSVHVNDVQLGGRVLSPDELHEEAERARALLSPVAEPPDPLSASQQLESLMEMLDNEGY
ncbi:hypothetical protein CNMCM8980_006477 [Aspergillus fumigatiaffinis]|uniref:Uncharacterized protein n=1 Tax=Aspergillus fumigatiaffinis TaxID=340414 RepID=A0A8H4M4F8_9EURO|nr:hypothetical protein CNMCM5878_007005 [Aspergillus fumigatiaffinis]KAF4229053.1 hypothetical protein CNMCM6457_006644 [Aspergillus fumigatiaffinis]KAF4236924.1 hypothetical protein CNMCM6805_007146 [Aspergillus fumigatiaffinis]KAF4248013.1 hypothetical protein CNMCM8980_006477 [Aspergillus fumigatiaffinis]